MTTPRTRRILRRLGLALVLGACIVVALRAVRRWVLPLPEDRCRTHRFDAVAWRDSVRVYSEAAVRGCMVDDLLARDQLRGRTRAEVVALLGEPRPTSYFREYDLVYWLGPERGLMSIDSEWLVFRLDSSGRVAEHALVTD